MPRADIFGLLTRTGLDWTHKYPAIAVAVAALPARQAYLDGELCIYAQRPEDRVLRRLVEKTEIIRKQLGSASPVIETRISELLAGGIERSRADLVAAEIDRIKQSDKERRARDDLEPVRCGRLTGPDPPRPAMSYRSPMRRARLKIT
jgi:hypothetical protein